MDFKLLLKVSKMNKYTSIYQFASIIIFILVFTILLIFNTKTYSLLSNEDNIIEYLSSIFLALSSYFLFRVFLYSRKTSLVNKLKWKDLILMFSAILFLLAAFEEISWGQRLFNFETPEFLKSINDQNELNFHNINKKFFDRIVDRITIVFVVIGSVYIFLKKDTFLGIKAPNIIIICIFSITLFYNQYNNFELDFYHIQYVPLIALLIFSVFNRDKISLYALLVTLIISVLIPIIHIKFNHLFPSHNNSANEYREFLFCVACLYYSFTIMNNFKLSATINMLYSTDSAKYEGDSI